MKTLSYLIIGILFISCQTKEFGSKGDIKQSQLSLVSAKKVAKSDDSITEASLAVEDEFDQKRFEMPDNLLLAYSQYAFLNNVEIDVENHEGKLKLVKEDEDSYNLFDIYTIEDEKMKAPYKHLIGNKMKVNNHNRTSYQAKIIDIVLVFEMWGEMPYIAAKFDLPLEDNIYYAWTCSVANMPYPFMPSGVNSNGVEHVELMEAFEARPEYSAALNLYDQTADEDQYSEVMIEEFEHFKGSKYQVVQFNVIGVCGGLVNDLTAVYKKGKAGYELLAIGELGYYVQDLIDVDNDGFPEVLGAEFTASAIFKIENQTFTLQEQLSWSSTECPC